MAGVRPKYPRKSKKKLMDNQRTCQNCGTINALDAMVCVKCGASLMRTLSFQLSEIDDRDPTFRILPAHGDPYTVKLTKRVLTFGSEAQQDIHVENEGVAPRHARAMLEGGNYRIFDVTTGSGLLVNGAVMDSALLRDGDVVRLQNANGQGATLTYSNPTERAMGTTSIGRIYSLDTSPYVIGRDPVANLQLDALSVSWHHARIDKQGNHQTITDTSSVNGTYVNDRRVTSPLRLRDDDVIRIDKALFIYQANTLQRLPSVQQFQIDAHDLAMDYSSGWPRRKITNTMRDVTLSVHPQEFIAVVGGSGSGKSTLLRALNGAARATRGQVLINGDDLYAHYTSYQPIIGYVPQKDIVQDNLTVRQTLIFGARLRFPNEPVQSRNQRIARVLQDLELTEFDKQFVRNLSGGQKKRVSIALEMMAEPGLLFMDEPSSGLDPGLDKVLMDTLRKLADRGHVVIVVTHTTLNIDLCDQLALMARGNLSYFGPPKEALSFFGVHNYSEIYNRVFQPPDPRTAGTQHVMMSEAARQWADRFRQSPQYAKQVLNRLMPPKTKEEAREDVNTRSTRRLAGSSRGSFLQQAQVLTERTFMLVRHDLRTFAGLLLVLPMVGLFLALINFDNTFHTRGQMLVSRGDDSTLRAEVLDKLPLTSVTSTTDKTTSAANPSAPAADAPAPQIGGQVRGMATYAPANDAQRLLFMTSLAVVLLGIFSAAYTIVEEKSLFLRERMVNLRLMPYLLSKLVVYGGFSLISCILLLIAISFGVRLPDHGVITWAPLELFITLALTSLAGVSLGLLISAVTGKIDAATYAVLGVLFIQILFPGVLFNMDGALKPLSQLTITRWSLEALGATANMVARNAEGRIVVVSDPVNPRTNQVLEGAPPSTRIFPSPSALSLNYATTASDLAVHWLVLILFGAVFCGVAALALSRSEAF